MNRIIIAGVSAGLAGPALAQPDLFPVPIINLEFTDLSGGFSASTGALTASAGSSTAGTVTRVVGETGSADFDAGFVDLADLGDVSLSLDVNVGGSPIGGASGVGSVIFTDANGDTIEALIQGDFFDLGGFITFEGVFTSVTFGDTSGDGTFDGSSGGSFATAFDGFAEPFQGSVVLISIDPVAGGFFGDDFQFDSLGLSASVTGLIPTPGTLAIVGLGGLAMSRRRR